MMGKEVYCDSCGVEMVYGWVHREPLLGDIVWTGGGNADGMKVYLGAPHLKMGMMRLGITCEGYDSDGKTVKEHTICPHCLLRFLKIADYSTEEVDDGNV